MPFFFFQMTIIAKDQRSPEKTGKTVVTINVVESQADINFVNLPNQVNIPDITQVQTIIFTVNSIWKKTPASGVSLEQTFSYIFFKLYNKDNNVHTHMMMLMVMVVAFCLIMTISLDTQKM